uniref:Uncharacterized protein n=1 Tax=Megaselia scalaris TaxID=36166 RepID=T1GSG7_MEGSC
MIIATHLARVIKYVGQNIQKYKKLDIVSEKEYKYFLNVHKDFYTNIFWKNVERKDLSEIILIAVADSLNSIYNSNDISYTFVFISKLIEQNGKTIISLKDLKQFQDHKIPEANLLVIQHLALCHDSELEFKESLKVLNISSKIDTLDGIFEKVTLFKNIKMCYLNFKQKMEFLEKGISISKNYYFNSDLLFESYELFVLKFLKIAKNSSDYIRILEILAVILEEEKFQKYLFQATSTIVNIFHRALNSNIEHVLKAVSRCNIHNFPADSIKQLQQMFPNVLDSKIISFSMDGLQNIMKI